MAEPIIQIDKIVKKPGLIEKIKRNKTAYLYTFPSAIVVLIFTLIPLLYGISLAFMNANIFTMAQGTVKFVGLRNFKNIIIGVDKEFLTILGRTFIWTAINVVLHVSLGTFIAILLNKKGLKFKGLYRSLLILPWAVPQLVSTLVWKILLNYDVGAINNVLESLGFKRVGWLIEPKTAFASVILVNVWLGVPFMMMVASGALQSIAEEYYEAAIIDGANWWDKFKSITLPMIKPAMLPATTLGVIWTFNNFFVVHNITQGNPAKATHLIQTYTYAEMRLGNYSKAASYGLVVFFILLIFTLINTKISKVLEEEVL